MARGTRKQGCGMQWVEGGPHWRRRRRRRRRRMMKRELQHLLYVPSTAGGKVLLQLARNLVAELPGILKRSGDGEWSEDRTGTHRVG